jgi:hypothetical protein
MKKLEALKVGGVQKEKKGKRTCFMSWKAILLLTIFSLLLFICTSKMISRA